MAKKDENGFEALVGRLEEIVERLEDEQLPLEESIRLFSEGVDLALKARGKLKSSEETVQKLIRTLDGGFELQPLE